jgi:hypothetical protein
MQLTILSEPSVKKGIPEAIHFISSTPLEDLILRAGTGNFELSFCGEFGNPGKIANGSHKIIAVYEEKLGKYIRRYYCPLEFKQLFKIYPKPAPLNERVVKFDDLNEYSPEPVWYDKRCRRLGIKYSKRDRLHTLPVRSIPEVILSYCLSSGGMVKVKRVLEADWLSRPQFVYQFSCILLGYINPEASWVEDLYISERKLKNYLQHSDSRHDIKDKV